MVECGLMHAWRAASIDGLHQIHLDRERSAAQREPLFIDVFVLVPVTASGR
jgi:hypothetical protein